MTTIKSFVERLKKIGVDVTLVGNYPWIYLDTVNGKKVQGRFQGNHGFTAFFIPVRREKPERITDIGIVFKKIRQTLNGIKCTYDTGGDKCFGNLHFISGGEDYDDHYVCDVCDNTYNVNEIDN